VRADGAPASSQRPAVSAQPSARKLARLSLLGHRTRSVTSLLVLRTTAFPVSARHRAACRFPEPPVENASTGGGGFCPDRPALVTVAPRGRRCPRHRARKTGREDEP